MGGKCIEVSVAITNLAVKAVLRSPFSAKTDGRQLAGDFLLQDLARLLERQCVDGPMSENPFHAHDGKEAGAHAQSLRAQDRLVSQRSSGMQQHNGRRPGIGVVSLVAAVKGVEPEQERNPASLFGVAWSVQDIRGQRKRRKPSLRKIP